MNRQTMQFLPYKNAKILIEEEFMNISIFSMNDPFVECEQISFKPIWTWTLGYVKRLFSEMKCLPWTTITLLYVTLWVALSTFTYYSTSTRFAAAEESVRRAAWPSASTTGGAAHPETSTTGRKQICEIRSWRETISIWDQIKTLPT